MRRKLPVRLWKRFWMDNGSLLGFGASHFARMEHPETLWPAFDRELLAARLATRNSRFFLEGRPFGLFTDQNSLVPAIRKKSKPHNARQANQLVELSEIHRCQTHQRQEKCCCRRSLTHKIAGHFRDACC